MRKLQLATFVAALALLAYAGTASAQSCTRSGCQVGPCVEENILVDPGLRGCPQWSFSGVAQRKPDGLGGYYAEFSNGYGVLAQNQVADLGSTFSLTYYVQFENTQPTYWQSLDIFIYDANTGQRLAWVESLNGYAGNFGWHRRDVNLGSHPDWVGRNLQVRFEGYAYYGAIFKVTSIYLWEGYW
jgi:hypothetical protein